MDLKKSVDMKHQIKHLEMRIRLAERRYQWRYGSSFEDDMESFERISRMKEDMAGLYLELELFGDEDE